MTDDFDPGPCPEWLTIEEDGEPSSEAIVSVILEAHRRAVAFAAPAPREAAQADRDRRAADALTAV